MRHQDVSVVRIHDVPLLRLYNVSCKSQTKHPNNVAVVRLHHVSELRCCAGLYVFKLLCHELNLVGFHASFKYQIKHQCFLVLTKRETITVVWIKKLAVILLHLITVTCINNICNIYCVDGAYIYTFLSKIIYGLAKES